MIKLLVAILVYFETTRILLFLESLSSRLVAVSLLFLYSVFVSNSTLCISDADFVLLVIDTTWSFVDGSLLSSLFRETSVKQKTA